MSIAPLEVLSTDHPRIKACRRLKNDFRRFLSSVLSPPAMNLPPQFLRSVPFKIVDDFIDLNGFDTLGASLLPAGALRRFVAGEFTDGRPPVDVPFKFRADIDRILLMLEVVELMAYCVDKQKRKAKEESEKTKAKAQKSSGS